MALVIVLGLLSLMTLLCVAFAIAMRVERLAARNYTDGIRSRSLVQAALVRAMTQININMVTPSPRCYPDWDALSSSGSGDALIKSLITGEALNSIPTSLVGAALAWSKEKHGLKVNSLAAGEKEKWDKLISPMVDEWVKDMTAKGYDAKGFIDRLYTIRDKNIKEN